jgi:ribonuclease P protein component
VKREFRITRSIDFKRVRRLGKSYAHPLVVLISAPGLVDHPRAGIITGKSIGGAVMRNRTKRQIRAILSETIPHIINPIDFVIIARDPIRNAKFEEIKSALNQLLVKSGLLSPG